MREYFISKYKENRENKILVSVVNRTALIIDGVNLKLNNPKMTQEELSEYLDKKLNIRNGLGHNLDLKSKNHVIYVLQKLGSGTEKLSKKRDFLDKTVNKIQNFKASGGQKLSNLKVNTYSDYDYLFLFARIANEYPDIAEEIKNLIGNKEMEKREKKQDNSEDYFKNIFSEYLIFTEENYINNLKEEKEKKKDQNTVSEKIETPVEVKSILVESKVEELDNLKVFLQDINSSKTDYLLDKLVILIGELEQDETRENELFLLKNLFKYFKSFGVQPLRKIGSTVTGGIESIIFGEYIGTPFKEKEVKDLEIVRAGWRYKEEIISPIVYKEKVKNMEENNG